MRLLAVSLMILLSCTAKPPERPPFHKTGDLEGVSGPEKGEEPGEPTETGDPVNPDPTEGAPAMGGPETGTPEVGDPPIEMPKPGEPTDNPKPDPKVPEPKPSLVLENGIYTIQNLASKKCLEITSADKNTSIVQFGCNGAGIQAFKIEALGKTEYKITNIETKKAFDIKDASKNDGAELRQTDFANGENQTFIIDYDASEGSAVNIKPKHSMKFLEIPDASNKSRTQPKQNAENKQDSQRWKLTKIAEPTKPNGVRYTFVNECGHDVWVGSQPNPGFPVVAANFKLAAGGYNKADTNDKWEGRFWGRYNCSMVNGKLQCESGNCAKGEFCENTYGEPPVALAEFRTKGYENIDFYDISLVDGTNLPMDIRPMPLTLLADGAKGSCKHLECKPDLRLDCPAELQKKNAAGKVIGCKSACEAFRTDEYCCLGAFAKANCRPSTYAQWFDQKCPDAYSFAEDVKTFTCRNADYEVIFCPK